jgi:uncharacterized delta-60 repeat protein
MVAAWLCLSGTLLSQVGGLDSGFSAGPFLNGASAGAIRAQSVLSDGRIIVAGDFTSVAGFSRGRIAKLTSAGGEDFFQTGTGANGTIHAIVVLADGKIVIGGEFTTFNGVARNRIARLLATGALDTTFDPGTGFNGPVYALAANSVSTYVGGDFTTANGLTRNRLAMLSSSGSPTSSTFGGGANAAVRALRLDSNYLYTGGDFTAAGGQTRNFFAYFSSISGVLGGSTASFNGPVYAIESISLTGSPSSSLIMMGGDFTAAAGSPRGRLAGFNFSSSTVQLDQDFNLWLDAPCRTITTVTTGSAKTVFIGGDFSSVNGQPRNRLARLTFTTTSSPGTSIEYWNIDANYGATGPDGPVNTLRVGSDGKPLLGGTFGNFGGSPTSSFVRLYGDAGSTPPPAPGSPAATKLSDSQIYIIWSSSALASAYSLERSPDGVAGWSEIYNGNATAFTDSGLLAGTTQYYRVWAANSNGSSAYSATVNATTSASPWTGSGSLLNVPGPGFADGPIASMVRQPDGKIVIAGSFLNVLGTPRKYLARLLPDLSLDPTFDPGAGPNSAVSQIALSPDGHVFIFGSFNTFAGVTRNDFARLNANGSLDLSFANDYEWTFSKGIAVQPDGKLIIFGDFDTFFDAPRANLARLNVDGSVDSGFNCFPNSIVYSAAIQADGKILLGGWFNSISGRATQYLNRVLPDGAVDPSFTGSFTSVFSGTVAALADRKCLVAGSFTTVNGAARKYLARLNADGSADASFDPGLSANVANPLIFPQPDGNLVITGAFTSFGGTPRWKLARLNANGTLDTTFDAEAGPGSGTISSVLTLPDSSILVGGSFTAFGASPRGYLARLKGDGYSVPPSSPANLAGVAVSSSSIQLTWDQVTDEYSLKIERRPAGAAPWQQIAELSWDVTTFVDTGLSAGTGYDYRIRAANAAGDSPSSATVTISTYTPFQQWKLEQGFSLAESAAADADEDGIALAVEYALALDPRVADRAGVPIGQVFGDVLALSYRRLRSDLLYSVEASTDLENWSALGVSQGEGVFPIAWTLKNGATQKYLRLKVTVP